MTSLDEATHFTHDLEHSDPVDHRIVDFDWNELFERTDGHEPSLVHNRQGQAAALRRVLQWLVAPGLDSASRRQDVLKRTVALAWVIDKSLLIRSPSLRQLAKHMHDKQPMSLSEHTAAASRTFGLRNRSQVGHCIAYHPKRKSTSKAVTRSGQSKGIF